MFTPDSPRARRHGPLVAPSTDPGWTPLFLRASAIVIGELKGCDEPGGGLTGLGVMAELLSVFPGPVIARFPSGHTSGPVFTLPFGVSCRVVANGRPRLVIEEAAVL